jgi:hypothetical protein
LAADKLALPDFINLDRRLPITHLTSLRYI